MRLAFCLIGGSFLDAMGRGDGDVASRRQRASEALKWLRQAGRMDPTRSGVALPSALKDEFVATMDWACSILSVDPQQIAWNGLHSIPNSGLRHWRFWRTERGTNRIKPLVPVHKVCALCGVQFLTKRPTKQTYCSVRCVHTKQRTREVQDREQPTRRRLPHAGPSHPWRRQLSVRAEAPVIPVGASSPPPMRRTSWSRPGYEGYRSYCDSLSLPAASELFYQAVYYA